MELIVGAFFLAPLILIIVSIFQRMKNTDNPKKEKHKLELEPKEKAKKAREIIMNSGTQKDIEFLELLDKINKSRKESRMKGSSVPEIAGGVLGSIAIIDLFTIIQQDLDDELSGIDINSNSSDSNFINHGSSDDFGVIHHFDDDF